MSLNPSLLRFGTSVDRAHKSASLRRLIIFKINVVPWSMAMNILQSGKPNSRRGSKLLHPATCPHPHSPPQRPAVATRLETSTTSQPSLQTFVPPSNKSPASFLLAIWREAMAAPEHCQIMQYLTVLHTTIPSPSMLYVCSYRMSYKSL